MQEVCLLYQRVGTLQNYSISAILAIWDNMAEKNINLSSLLCFRIYIFIIEIILLFNLNGFVIIIAILMRIGRYNRKLIIKLIFI